MGTGLLALASALLLSGAVQTHLMLDPGPLARWGAPASALVVRLAAAVVLGSVLLGLTALGPGRPEFPRALDLAAAGGIAWALGSAASAFFAYWSASGAPPDPATAGALLGKYLTAEPLGQAWLIMTVVGTVIAVLCFVWRTRGSLLAVVAVALVALARLSAEGHPADGSAHELATTAGWLHSVAAGAWLGALVTLMVLRPVLDAERLVVLYRRYSTIAAIAFVVVAISGVVVASIRLGQSAVLLGPSGALVLVKLAALVALGLLAAVQRRTLLRRIAADARSRMFWVAVGAELAFLGIASGVATALTSAGLQESTATAVRRALTPAEILTGAPVPPEPTPIRWLISWRPDLLWLLIVLFGTVAYLAGVRRLHGRGERWPLARTVSWSAGMLVLLWSTSGMPNAYREYLFSVQTAVLTVLATVVPILLVLGAPLRLGVRAIRPREDGSTGAREWILGAAHSRVARVLTHPLVAAGIFAASLAGLSSSDLLRWAVTDGWGHAWVSVQVLLVGCLVVLSLIGSDPARSRRPFPLRLVLVLSVAAAQAFLSVALISSPGLVLADWYGAMGRTWGSTPLADQQAAGWIALSIGGTATLALAVAVLWSRRAR